MEKVISLHKKADKLTYLESIQKHIDNLTQEEKDTEVSMVVLTAYGKDGNYYSILAGDSIVQAIGLLEISKLLILDGCS